MTILGLFLNEEVRSGGHKRYLELLSGLAERGNTVIAFFNKDQNIRPKGVIAIELEIKRHKLQAKSHAFKVSILTSLKNNKESLRGIEKIVVFGETNLSAAIALKKHFNVPLLYSHRSNAVRESLISLKENQGNVFKTIQTLLSLLQSRFYEKKITNNADRIVFQSPYDFKDFVSREPRSFSKSLIIRGNIGEPRFKNEYINQNSSDKLRKILFIGTFGERKGIKYFLNAVSILRSRGHTDLKYEIIGYGSRQSEFEDFVLKHELNAQVKFLGRLSNPFPAIIASDLLVVPSLFDSYPNTVLEALHVGTPVIASSVGGIPDILHYEELLFPVMDAHAIADRIEKCIFDPEFYQQLKSLCAERRKEFLFEWAQAFENVMKEDS